MNDKFNSFFLHRKLINRMLPHLNLPKDEFTVSMSEEEMFIRTYDIKTFGFSNDINIQKLWLSKERALNSFLGF